MLLHLNFKAKQSKAMPSDAYFMFRAFVPGDAETASLHSIRMDEEERAGGDKVFKAIFHQKDPVVWFDV
ncbi:hypothetical protein LCER1_G009335 [Lachnellula cervina]|uniref:Uncharacterized protein n=1 Tax=Lachnellula cervina TaxID=1316786 RepID=A0A7D8YI11_9HELO|nr:hypothetical protein LCER1_G009335 [Lachnellula cervina]